jgi:hypothetical protein
MPTGSVMKYLYLFFILMACTGCMTQKKIDRVLTELPPFMRKNIGQVKYEPFSPLSLALAGQVIETDPTATIYLYALANEEVLKHEAFHSFELLAMYNRPIEWQDYYMCMGNMEVKLSTHLTLFSPIPPQWLPSSSSGTLYGELNHFEDGAEVFVHHRPEKKWDCVCRFTNGLAQNQSHLRPKFAKSESKESAILSIIRDNFHNMALSHHEANTAEREPTDSTILSIIRANYQNRASSHQKANAAKREPTDSTILSIIRHNFQEMVLSYQQQENTER